MEFEISHYLFKSRKSISMFAMWVLFGIVGLSSVQDNGIYSQNYQHIVFIAYVFFIIVCYALIIYVMKSVGLDPNRMEMLIIPGIILSIIYFTLEMIGVNTMPSNDVYNTVTSSTNEITLSSNSKPNTHIPGDGKPIPTVIIPDNGAASVFTQILSFIGMLFVFILMVIFVIYLIKKQRVDLPDIKLSREITYDKNKAPNIMAIMDIYIRVSMLLEKSFKKAPRWYTPTHHYLDILNDPGLPLGGYYRELTEIYELARFSAVDVSQDLVNKAQELEELINEWVDDYITNRRQIDG